MVRYTVPMPEDSLIPGRATEEVALHGPLLSTVKYGGPGWDRTNDQPVMSRLLYH